MQDLIKRYFWVLGLVVVVVCAIFAAKATGYILASKYLGDPEHGPKVVAVAKVEAPVKQVRSKDGSAFSTRNMFCSDCTPPVEVKTSNDPTSIAMTQLPLLLLATSIGPGVADSFATIVNTESQRQGAYALHAKVPGASGNIIAIHPKFIDFENNGHTERLGLVGTTPPITPVAQAAPELPSDENKDDMQASIDSGIKKIDDTNYEIDKSLVDKVLLNPMAVAKGARVVPAMKNGKPDGFKLYAIRPSSAFAKLGLTNGDTLQSINGFELTSADKALEAYTKLKEATSLEVEVTRRGKPVTLKYTVK